MNGAILFLLAALLFYTGSEHRPSSAQAAVGAFWVSYDEQVMRGAYEMAVEYNDLAQIESLINWRLELIKVNDHKKIEPRRQDFMGAILRGCISCMSKIAKSVNEPDEYGKERLALRRQLREVERARKALLKLDTRRYALPLLENGPPKAPACGRDEEILICLARSMLSV